jgi:hypothetical protein
VVLKIKNSLNEGKNGDYYKIAGSSRIQALAIKRQHRYSHAL